MPNFRESDPSKIAVGFGGTVNLVVGLLYLLLILVLMSMPVHLHYAGFDLQSTNTAEHELARITVWWVRIGLALGLILGAATVVLPLRLGARSLRRMEF
jgi:ABC-2 type transport system permease protein